MRIIPATLFVLVITGGIFAADPKPTTKPDDGVIRPTITVEEQLKMEIQKLKREIEDLRKQNLELQKKLEAKAAAAQLDALAKSGIKIGDNEEALSLLGGVSTQKESGASKIVTLTKTRLVVDNPDQIEKVTGGGWGQEIPPYISAESIRAAQGGGGGPREEVVARFTVYLTNGKVSKVAIDDLNKAPSPSATNATPAAR